MKHTVKIADVKRGDKVESNDGKWLTVSDVKRGFGRGEVMLCYTGGAWTSEHGSSTVIVDRKAS